MPLAPTRSTWGTRETRPRREPSRPARAAVLASAMMTLMAAAIIAPSLPAMREAFAGTPGADLLVRFALTVTSLAIAVSAPASGLVADRVGRRPVLVGGLLLSAVGGTAGLLVTDLYALLATRVLLGVAVGAVMTAVGAMITDWFDGPRRASYLGLQQAFASLGGVVFLPLAGVLAAADWRAPFWLYAVSAAVAVFAIGALRGEPQRAERSGGHERTEHAEYTEATAPAAAPDGPPRPHHPAATGRVPGIYALALVATLAFYMAPTQLPFLLGGHGVGPATTGAVIAGSTLTGAVGALAFPVLRRRLAPAVITALGVALLGAGWLLVGTAGAVGPIAAGLLIGGAGVGVTVPDLNLRLSELARPDRRGRVLSGLVTAIFLGQFLSPLAADPLIRTTGLAAAFTWTGAVMAAGAAVAAIAVIGPWAARMGRNRGASH
ncbi:MFS transporter [Nocardiopsis sp. RSe5-2]|uniref:MFS transporter n=1 Tax=Nocardiopsis endophytica TaxID=3018445 RepID=A0ABT4U191_9ACTN|nr:MFS transporter [Nocardiopsis endophytica]MDA2810132.1 MFS transporter [Nocardiopsis endophytica]